MKQWILDLVAKQQQWSFMIDMKCKMKGRKDSLMIYALVGMLLEGFHMETCPSSLGGGSMVVWRSRARFCQWRGH